MNNKEIILWLLEGDPTIQYQCHKELLGKTIPALQNRMKQEGWAAELLSNRNPDGSWGPSFYQPKWTSSHYTLLDLRNMCISPDNKEVLASIEKIALEYKAVDGGINPGKTISESDTCINGMFLNYASYFGLSQKILTSVVDFIISQQLPDGGFNCQYNRSGAIHSSLHTTLSIAEGIREYLLNDYDYRRKELEKQEGDCREFILIHQLFLSDRTGAIIKKDFLRFAYPGRWKYDILCALDYFQYAQCAYDPRLQAALDVLIKKRNKAGTWNLQAHHPGKRHFDMEKVGHASRWNTLRSLRILKHFNLWSILHKIDLEFMDFLAAD